MPFAALPPLTDPTSPFHPAVTLADGPAPQPVVSAAPPSLPLNPTVDSKVNPDGSVTELTFGPNGPITRTRVPGGPADPPWQDANQPQSTASSSGATQLEVVEEDLSAGQNNNQGNTKNRTGSDDGKKDKDKQDNGGGGNGNSNNNSSGGHHK